MNIKIGILNVPKHCNKHDLIHFVTGWLFIYNLYSLEQQPNYIYYFDRHMWIDMYTMYVDQDIVC